MIFTGRITTVVHRIIEDSVREGSIVLDGTVGNGNDTLYLAHRVGKTGKVYGFDIQEQAIECTKEKLIKEKVVERVELIHDTHTKIQRYVKEELDLVIFNLGYLPKSNKKIITKAESTLDAILQSLDLLKNGGILAITSYYGHEGGKEEKDAVEEVVSKLDSKFYNVAKVDFLNRPNNPPIIYMIEKN
ncbi:class I SAM-dependent methyltransferase [Vallitalea okinawensis]|uniref:class I SAM-dependent methyltransferase n=1 Tax=Vallitalea okinawensis TaxID=2078660 RepID=UPI000CFD56CF|nr:class I SAM-dependent methyltransferase [Vallitalea okinawensis]